MSVLIVKFRNSIPYSEAMVADAIPTYTPVALNGGTIKHDATLFNLGAVYHLTDAQQVSQTFLKDQIYRIFNVCFVMYQQVLL